MVKRGLTHGIEDLPRPGLLSGLCVLIGAITGAGLLIYLHFYGAPDGVLAKTNIFLIIILALIFGFLTAAFCFVIGWIFEIIWPLLLLAGVIGTIIAMPLIFYFGYDNMAATVKQNLRGFFSESQSSQDNITEPENNRQLTPQ